MTQPWHLCWALGSLHRLQNRLTNGVSRCTLRWFKTVLVPFHFNWIRSHGFCDSQILHKVSATGSLIPPSKAPSSPLPGNLPFKFDMAGILISSQRHSDNFTTKQGGVGVLFSALIKRATVLSLSPRAKSWHQAGETSNLVLQHPSDAMSLGPSKVNCSCLKETLQSCLEDSQPLFYVFSSWQRNQEVFLSQDPRQVMFFPKLYFNLMQMAILCFENICPRS